MKLGEKVHSALSVSFTVGASLCTLDIETRTESRSTRFEIVVTLGDVLLRSLYAIDAYLVFRLCNATVSATLTGALPWHSMHDWGVAQQGFQT